jgi:hypothetical protein
VSNIFLRAAAPDLLTRRLRIGDFFELRLKQKSPQNQFCELSSVLVCQPVIPLGL